MSGSTTQEIGRNRLDNDTWCLILAATQVAGGISGLVMYALNFGEQPLSLSLTIIFAPSLWGVYSGVLLWQGKMRGLQMSIWLSAIQIPLVMFPLFGYKFCIAAMLAIGWVDSHIALFHIGYNSNLYLNSDPGSRGFAVNVLALAMLWYLLKAKKRLEETGAEAPMIQEKSPLDAPQV